MVLPVSTVVDRYRKDYYEAIHGASQSLDWTDWAKFFIPVLSETLSGFLSAARFISAKGAYLSTTRYRLAFDLDSHEPIEPINEPLNGPLNEPRDEGLNEGIKPAVYTFVRKSPGTRVPPASPNLQLAKT